MNYSRTTPGTQGYAEKSQTFINATLAIDFRVLHQDFIEFFPKSPSRILDVGAGIGRDAWEFSKMGHAVVAVEPVEELRVAGKRLFDSRLIEWVDDSLPDLKSLEQESNFDFILASGVVHHLDSEEQLQVIRRASELLAVNGIFAVSLRNGPAGLGSHVFPTDSDLIARIAESFGLNTLLKIDKQPSLMKNKKEVVWSKLVLQKKWTD